MKNTHDTTFIKNFHDNYSGDYKGSLISPTIIARTKKFIGSKILDAGAGDGTLIKLIQKKFPSAHVSGIDLSPKSPLVEEGDLTDMQFEDSSFDTIYCMDVIEHVNDKDLDSIIHEFSRVLKKNGVVIITTKNNEDLERNSITCPNCEEKFHRVGHQQVFDELRLQKIMKKHGLAQVYFETANFTFLAKTGLAGNLLYKTKLAPIVFKFFHLEDKLNGDLMGVYKKQ